MKGFQLKKKPLTLHNMCVTSLLCGPWADLWPFYGLYCKRCSLYIRFASCYVSRFLLKCFHFRRLQRRSVFSHINFERYATMPMFADAHISSLGYLWLSKRLDKEPFKVPFSFCFSLLRIHQKVKSRYLLIRWRSQGLLGPLEVSLLTKRSRYKVYKVHAN